jgi:hypothetical protein
MVTMSRRRDGRLTFCFHKIFGQRHPDAGGLAAGSTAETLAAVPA